MNCRLVFIHAFLKLEYLVTEITIKALLTMACWLKMRNKVLLWSKGSSTHITHRATKIPFTHFKCVAKQNFKQLMIQIKTVIFKSSAHQCTLRNIGTRSLNCVPFSLSLLKRCLFTMSSHSKCPVTLCVTLDSRIPWSYRAASCSLQTHRTLSRSGRVQWRRVQWHPGQREGEKREGLGCYQFSN